jgi:hypothetical protein
MVMVRENTSVSENQRPGGGTELAIESHKDLLVVFIEC